MTREDALTLARRLQEAANGHDVAALIAHYAPDAVAISPAFGELRGRDAIAGAWEGLFRMFPDCHFEMSDVLVDGDRLAILGSVEATDRGGWFGLPPTGSRITYRLSILCAIAGGAIVRDERVFDSAGVAERLQKALVDQELKTAAQVQRALLPRTSHSSPHCVMVGDSIPCRSIGGDFFEFTELADGDLGIALGDVAGKGAPAALLGALLLGMFAAEALVRDAPARTLARINRQLAARCLDSRFVTLVYGVLSPSGRFVYTNAGHNAPALLGRETRRLDVGGPPLGVFAEATFEEETIQLDDQDTLLMFTDGVSEACNARGEEFGDERLVSCATTDLSAAPAVLLQRLFAELRAFARGTEQADDMTLAITRFHR